MNTKVVLRDILKNNIQDELICIDLVEVETRPIAYKINDSDG